MSKKQIFFFFLFFVFLYIGVSRFPYSTDTIPATYMPIGIIRGAGFDLQKIYPHLLKILPTGLNADKVPYYVMKENGHYLSNSPIFSSLLATPIYFLPVMFKNITLDNLENYDSTILFLGTVSASIFTAISVTFVALTLLLLVKKKQAMVLTFAYSLGTSTLSLSSQALWQHGASQMFLSICLYFFIKGQTQKNLLPLCGLFLGFAFLSRFANLPIVLAFSIYFIFYGRKIFIAYIIFALPALAFFAWYQLHYLNNLLFFRYEGLGQDMNFSNSLITGFLGLLVAPNKGLFVYSPIFLISVLGMFNTLIHKNKQLIFISLIVIIHMLFIAKWSSWGGGWSYGPRMLTDITPFLIILMVPVLKNPKIWGHRNFRILFYLLLSFSIFVHFLGATVADLSWYSIQTLFLTTQQIQSASFLWSWKYPEIYSFYLGAGGIFGVIYVFSKALTSIFLTELKGFAAIICAYIIVRLIKNRFSKFKI